MAAQFWYKWTFEGLPPYSAFVRSRPPFEIIHLVTQLKWVITDGWDVGEEAEGVGWLDTNECDLAALGWLPARQTFQIMNGGARGSQALRQPHKPRPESSPETPRSFIRGFSVSQSSPEKEAGFEPEAAH